MRRCEPYSVNSDQQHTWMLHIDRLSATNYPLVVSTTSVHDQGYSADSLLSKSLHVRTANLLLRTTLVQHCSAKEECSIRPFDLTACKHCAKKCEKI